MRQESRPESETPNK